MNDEQLNRQLVDDANAIRETIHDNADAEMQALNWRHRAKLAIGYRLCQWLGVIDSISVIVAVRIENRLEAEIFRVLESSDLANRYFGIQMATEGTTSKLGSLEDLVRRSFKAFRAEQANCQVLIAKQRDEIGALEGRIRKLERFPDAVRVSESGSPPCRVCTCGAAINYRILDGGGYQPVNFNGSDHECTGDKERLK